MMNNQTNTEKARRNDLILISTVLLVAMLGLLLVFLLREEGAYAVVKRNGEEIGRYSLSENVEVLLKDGEKENLLVIKDGKVMIREANCPDKLCVHMRAAFYRGETVVCLPHGIVVTVYSAKDSDVDMIV